MTEVIDTFRIALSQRRTAIGLWLLAAAVSGGCTGASTQTTAPEDSEPTAVISAEGAEPVAQDQLSNGAAGFIGKTVSLRGEVRAVVEDVAFLLEDERVFGGEDILVINGGEPVALVNGDESDLQVIGIVQQLVLADLERDHGIKLDPSLYADYENRPAVIANMVLLAPGPGELTKSPEKFYSQRIAVVGEVDDILSPTVFTLDEEQFFGGEDLLVINSGKKTQVEDDQEVVVTGILRPYVKEEFAREYTLNWDSSVQAEVDADYADEPVFVADEIHLPTP